MKPSPPLSQEFRAAATTERDALIDRYEKARELADSLTTGALEASAEADRYARAAREIGELLGLEGQLSLVDLGTELRGQRLREVAIDVLRRHFSVGDVVHYKEWAALVVADGYTIGGKNPSATFLTQIASIDIVKRVGRRSGRYELRAAA